jgi:cyclase
MRVLWALLLGITSSLAYEYDLKAVNVDQGIYCFFGKPEVMNEINNGNMVNSCYVDAGRHWLVIDSGPTYAYAKEAADIMQQIKTMPVGLVVDTHVHDDHWLGNGYFEAKGIEVIGPTLFKQTVNPDETTRMQKRISEAAYKGTKIKLPTRYVDENTTLMLDAVQIRLIRVDRKAHTPEDILVYVPALNTLFAGDLVFNDRVPSLRDGSINGWIAALEMIRKMPLKHIIGGHGTATGPDAADTTYRYLVQLRAQVREAIENDIGIADATRQIQLDAFKDLGMYDTLHAQNVEAAYRMLEWEDE